MKELLLRHYIATSKRGLISHNTTLGEFMKKISEEYHELYGEWVEDIWNIDPTPEFIHESIDLVAVILNMLKHYDIDFIEEYRKNVEHQESRINIDSKPVNS